MEFHEKLQQLRKHRGLTQEELAQQLFVSRAAVSKWESARGYPNIDSLKAIAKFYGVTVDELLSGEEVLILAEEDRKQSTRQFQDLVFGLLDLSTAVIAFLPFFGELTEGVIRSVSLLSLSGISPGLKGAYYTAVLGLTLWGALTLGLQNCSHRLWQQHKRRVSLLLHTLGTLLFILSAKPYPAAFLFLFLGIKLLILAKKP